MIKVFDLPSILDQIDNYYAEKRPAPKGGAVTVPVNLRHPNAGEFFNNLMLRQKNASANNNTVSNNVSTVQRKESTLVSA